MAQYKTHAKFNILLVLPPLFIAIYYSMHPSLALILSFAGSYIYATLFMNPDVDLAYQIKLFSLKGLLTLPFRSYAYFFRHRGLSHSILLGTMTRILWLLLIAMVFLYLGNHLFLAKKRFLLLLKEYHPYIVYSVSGIFCADVFHILLDKMTPKKA